jgi:hypothetical protein
LSSQFDYYNTSTIRPGLTLNPIIGAKFYGTATSAETIAGFDPTTALTEVDDLDLTGRINVYNDYGLRIGTDTDIAIFVTTSGIRTSVVGGTVQGRPLEIRYNNVSSGTNAVAMHIDSTNSRIGIRRRNPLADVDIQGDVIVRGGLTVIGTQTSINVSVIKVQDINIELATGQTTATNAYVEGGGIILHGTTDHTFTYTNAVVNSVQLSAWQSNIDVNLASDNQRYQISGTNVLLADAGRPGKYRLGDDVTAAPGLVNLPVLSALTVTNLTWSGVVDQIVVLSGGSGYTQAPSVIINGDGQNATATAVISTFTGAVTSIVMNNKGTGYTYANASLSGPTAGTPATVDATVAFGIGTLVGPAPHFSVNDLYLVPSSGNVNLNFANKIINMPDPTTGYDSANKRYVDNELALQLGGYYGRKPYTLSLDITDFDNIDEDILTYLELTLPVDGYGDAEYAQPDGSRVSVLCTNYVATTATYIIDNLNTSTTRQTITYVPSVGSTVTNTTTVVTDFELAGSITITSPLPLIERTVRLYQVLAGSWTFVRTIDTQYLNSYDSIYVADIPNAVAFSSIAPTTSSLTSISLPSVAGIRNGHKLTADPITTNTTVVSVNTAASTVEITPALATLLPAATTVTFSYSPGAVIYMQASGPATLGLGTSVTVQDKTTLQNLLTGTLTSRSSSSYISTMTVGITIASATIGSTGTYSNWLISLGGA